MLVNWLGRSKRAIPKSITFTVPSSHSQMFSGLMSRWTVSRCGELECGTQLIGDAAHLGNREPLGQLGAAVDLLPQVVAFEELHGQERRAGGLVEVVDADDVGVGQGAGDPGLVQEPFEGLGISQELREEELDGDLFLADTVEGDEDLAHAAGADVARTS